MLIFFSLKPGSGYTDSVNPYYQTLFVQTAIDGLKQAVDATSISGPFLSTQPYELSQLFDKEKVLTIIVMFDYQKSHRRLKNTLFSLRERYKKAIIIGVTRTPNSRITIPKEQIEQDKFVETFKQIMNGVNGGVVHVSKEELPWKYMVSQIAKEYRRLSRK